MLALFRAGSISRKYPEGGNEVGHLVECHLSCFSFPLQMPSITPMSGALLRNEQSQANLSPSNTHAHKHTHGHAHTHAKSRACQHSETPAAHCHNTSFLSFSPIRPPPRPPLVLSPFHHSSICEHVARHKHVGGN